MLRDNHSRIVMGFQHQGVKQILQPEILAGVYVQLYLRHTGRIGAGRRIIVHMAVFQREDAGHNFCGACHGKYLAAVLFIEYAAGVRVHQNSGLGVQFKGRGAFGFRRRSLFYALCQGSVRGEGDGYQQEGGEKDDRDFAYIFHRFPFRVISSLNLYERKI